MKESILSMNIYCSMCFEPRIPDHCMINRHLQHNKIILCVCEMWILDVRVLKWCNELIIMSVMHINFYTYIQNNSRIERNRDHEQTLNDGRHQTEKRRQQKRYSRMNNHKMLRYRRT